jgi:fused signal recognition particle receptor
LFDLLKKKIGKFTEKVKNKLEADSQTAVSEEKAVPVEEPSIGEEEGQPPIEEKPVVEEEATVEEAETAEEEPAVKEIEKPEDEEKPQPVEEPELNEEPSIEGKEKPALVEDEPVIEEAQKEGPAKEEALAKEEPEDKRELKPKVSVRGRLKAAFTGSVELKESDLEELLEELELALLESDVEQSTAEEICRKIRKRLKGQKIPRGKNVEAFVKKEISEILLELMKAEKIDVLERARQKKDKPLKILFLGPNGAGKTTSIAKLTWLFKENGLKVIWAAGDTFRAASIEQLEKHAKKLGVRVIKHQYGADPAAVAFDAVKAAESKKIDVTLIDSAGRQETNRNLMGELEKIVRVVKPDLKIFVGEAYTGQSLLQQAAEYDKMVGIDGFILTKIDCDSKGGTTISLLYKIGKPILFVGTGQEYKDLRVFEPGFILERVIG